MRAKVLLTALLSILVGGCSVDPDLGDLEHFILEVKKRKPPPPPPLPPPKAFLPISYIPEGRDPFTPAISGTPSPESESSISSIQPDLDRPREPLEQFDLDALTFVGTLRKKQEVFALIKDPEDKVHVVQVGNHLGRNFGRIIAISETEIKIRELVPEAPQRWRERFVNLNLGK